MRAGYRAERQNQNRENRAGRKRVAEKRERAVTAGELRGHDAGADNAGEQKRRPKPPQALAPTMASRRLAAFAVTWCGRFP